MVIVTILRARGDWRTVGLDTARKLSIGSDEQIGFPCAGTAEQSINLVSYYDLLARLWGGQRQVDQQWKKPFTSSGVNPRQKLKPGEKLAPKCA